MPVSPEMLAAIVTPPAIPAAGVAEPVNAPDAAIPQDGADTPPVGAELRPETPEYPYEIEETGERYRSDRDLLEAKRHASLALAEAKREKRELMELLKGRGNGNGQHNGNGQAADPIAARAASIEYELRQEYPTETPENIRAEAQRLAKYELRAEQRAEERTLKTIAERENMAVVEANPFLMEPWAEAIFDEYRPKSAAAHLKLVQALAPDRIPQGQRTAPATPPNPQQVVRDRYTQQQQQLRQPALGGQGSNVGANGGDPAKTALVDQVYAQYCAAKPRATAEQKTAALNRIRGEIMGAQ